MEKEISDVLEKIRLTRVQKQVTVIDLADKAEISRSYLFYIESKKKVPTLTVLYRLAKALDVDMKDFFE